MQISKILNYFFKSFLIFVLLVYLLIFSLIGINYIFSSKLKNDDNFITHILEKNTTLDWNIEGAQIDWNWLSPIFYFSSINVKISDGSDFDEFINQEVLSSSNGYFKLDLIQSFFNFSPQFKEIKADNLNLTFFTKQGSSWKLLGAKPESQLSFDHIFSNLNEIDIDNFRINLLRVVESGKNDHIQLDPYKVSFKYFEKIKQLSIIQKNSNFETFNLILQSNGQMDERDFKFDAYINFHQFELAPLLIPFNFAFEFYDEKDFSGQATLSKEYKKPWTFRLDIDNSFVTKHSNENCCLSNIKMNLAAEYTDKNNLDLWWDNLQGLWLGYPINFESAAISFEKKTKLFKFKTPLVDIGQIAKITKFFNLLPKNIASILEELNLNGIAKNLNISVPLNSIERTKGAGLLEDFSIEPWRKVPGIKSLNAYFNFSDLRGSLQVKDQAKFSVYFPKIYEKPFDFNYFSGKFDWSISESRFLISSNNIDFNFDNISKFSSRFNLNAKTKEDDINSQLSLEIGVKNARAKKLKKLLPLNLNKDLLNWLEQSNIDGDILDGGFVYNGSLLRGDKKNKSIHFYLNMDDGKLFFNPNYPELENIDGLWVMNDSILNIDLISSFYSGINLDSTKIELNRLDVPPSLSFESKLSGSLSDAWEVFLKTPMVEKRRQKLKSFNFYGELESSDLSFKIPIKKSKEDIDLQKVDYFDISFSTLLGDVEFKEKNHNLFIKKINGEVSFDKENGFRSNSISALIFDEPLELIFGDDSNGSRELSFKNTYMDAKFVLSIDKFSEWSGRNFNPILHGKTSFDVSFESVPESSKFSFNSNMKGVSFNLPSSFGKVEEHEVPLEINWLFKKDHESINVNLFERFNADFRLEDSKLSSGIVVIDDFPNSSSSKKFESENSLIFTGILDRFVVNDWLDIYRLYQEEEDMGLNFSESNQSKINIKFRDLNIKKIEFEQFVLNNSILDLDKENNRWKIGLQNSLLAGSLVLPPIKKINSSKIYKPINTGIKEKEEQRFLFDLDYFNISTSTLESKNIYPFFSPNKWFLADIKIDKLKYKDKDFGSWEFLISPTKDSVLFHNINAKYDEVKLSSSYENGLQWSLNDDKSFNTKFNIQVITSSPHGLVKIHKPNIDSIFPFDCKETNFNILFEWPDIPTKFNLNDSSGEIDFNFQNGSFVNTSSPAEGLLKLVSLFNFNSIFSGIDYKLDRIYKEGIQFSSMLGKLKLEGEIVSFEDNPIEVNTLSSKFILTGFADLEDSKINSTLVATLPVKDNLPWFAALSGGLPMAAGVYLATQVFDKEIDRLSSVIYQVNGDLDNPDISFDKIFDNDIYSK